jgi:hypothetical protein
MEYCSFVMIRRVHISPMTHKPLRQVQIAVQGCDFQLCTVAIVVID